VILESDSERSLAAKESILGLWNLESVFLNLGLSIALSAMQFDRLMRPCLCCGRNGMEDVSEEEEEEGKREARGK